MACSKAPPVCSSAGGGKKPEIDEEQVKELHAKIGELALANSFLERKLKTWGGK
ncbi:30S ribosomal protein S6 [Salipiger bermudensis]|uniref:30S ribosomal protein S6 n=1 Tax=Salipiger bermudensis TaxID=344736 RepID=UPI001CD2A7C2|nr:30S ribosomal protein S6 [Salipiger bermudensis]MCA0964747.1 30S ribosomal protein S6 [Salipiger bermudensis]